MISSSASSNLPHGMSDTRLTPDEDENICMVCSCERVLHTTPSPAVGFGVLVLFAVSTAMDGLPLTEYDYLQNLSCTACG